MVDGRAISRVASNAIERVWSQRFVCQPDQAKEWFGGQGLRSPCWNLQTRGPFEGERAGLAEPSGTNLSELVVDRPRGRADRGYCDSRRARLLETVPLAMASATTSAWAKVIPPPLKRSRAYRRMSSSAARGSNSLSIGRQRRPPTARPNKAGGNSAGIFGHLRQPRAREHVAGASVRVRKAPATRSAGAALR